MKMSLGVSFWQAFLGPFALVRMMWIGTCFFGVVWFATDWLWYAWITLIGFSELSMQELSTTFSLCDNLGIETATAACCWLLRRTGRPHFSMPRDKASQWLASSSSKRPLTALCGKPRSYYDLQVPHPQQSRSKRHRQIRRDSATWTWLGLAFVYI